MNRSTPGTGRHDFAAAMPRPHALRILRAYINSFSLPVQGPHSGSLVWITREQALEALTALEDE